MSESTQAELENVENAVVGRGGESLVADMVLEHIVTRITDEGLIIEIFDLEGDPLFDREGTPLPILTQIAGILSAAFDLVDNQVSIAAHSSAFAVVDQVNSAWDVTMGRAQVMRRLIEQKGLSRDRTLRVTGFGQQKPHETDPMAIRNNRLEVTLLRNTEK